MSEEIANGAVQILNSIDQTNSAIENVSTTAQQSAERSERILSSVDETTFATREVNKSAHRQAKLSEELNSLIHKFIIVLFLKYYGVQDILHPLSIHSLSVILFDFIVFLVN